MDADALGEALADAKHAREELARVRAELATTRTAQEAAHSGQTEYRDAQAEAREAHFDTLLSNIESYDGTENGQRTVIPL